VSSRDDSIAVLEGAKKILMEKGWTQGHYAFTADHEPVHPTDERATCFCIAGAVSRAWNDLKYKGQRGTDAYKQLQAVSGRLHKEGPIDYNDKEGRTKEEVLALIDHTLKGLRRGKRT
jgi:hypothetical protein